MITTEASEETESTIFSLLLRHLWGENREQHFFLITTEVTEKTERVIFLCQLPLGLW